MCNCLPFPEHTDSPRVVSGFMFAQSLVFCVVFCRKLFVILSLFRWPLYCLSFFDLRLQIILLHFHFDHYIICPSLIYCFSQVLVSLIISYTLHEHLSPHLFCGVRVAHLFSRFFWSYYGSLRFEFRVEMSWFRLYSHKKTHDSTIFRLIYIYNSTFLCGYCNRHNNTELRHIIEEKTIKKMRNTDPPKNQDK